MRATGSNYESKQHSFDYLAVNLDYRKIVKSPTDDKVHFDLRAMRVFLLPGYPHDQELLFFPHAKQ